MHRIDFEKPKTALEVREPAIHVGRNVASEYGLFCDFSQSQQDALSGNYRSKNRQRIGNGKHKVWALNFQTDPTNTSRPDIIGRLILRSDYNPELKEFGGFDYGKGKNDKPTYSFVRVLLNSEIPHVYRPLDPPLELVEHYITELEDEYRQGQEQLFDISKYADQATSDPYLISTRG